MPSFIIRYVFIILLTSIHWNAAQGVRQLKRSPHAVKDKHIVPRKWSKIGPAPAQHVIQLQIGLKQGNFDELERHLYEVSDPFHPRYGQHLTASAVNDLIRPSQSAVRGVEDWLCGCGIQKGQLQYSPAKDWIKVALPIEKVESLLATKYSVFKHEDGSMLVRTPEWSLPAHLHEHIQTIQPTNSFLRSKAKISALRVVPGVVEYSMPSSILGSNKATVAQACNVTAVTTACLRTLYGTANYTVQSASKNSIGITNFGGETANRSDITAYLKKFRSEAASSSSKFKVQTVNGAKDIQSQEGSTDLEAGLGLEGNLDAETVLGISYPTPMTVYNTAGMPPFQADLFTPDDSNEPFLDWQQFMLSNQTTMPSVISISYGDDEQTVPRSYANAVCQNFAMMGAMGVTVMVASGDDGVGPQGLCFTNDGKNTTSFLPELPASCPYVTTVGGTKNVNPEVVAVNADGSFASGGGFSNYFTRPAYQDNIVPSYMEALGTKFKGQYNMSGRGYPDISAQAFQYLIVWNGTVRAVSGTSAATPTAASVMALVNDAMIAAGKPVMGFMNPWLYSVGSKAFTDVTSGSALGCNTTGFAAAPGWDAVTGFGTPNFNAIVAAAMNSSSVE